MFFVDEQLKKDHTKICIYSVPLIMINWIHTFFLGTSYCCTIASSNLHHGIRHGYPIPRRWVPVPDIVAAVAVDFPPASSAPSSAWLFAWPGHPSTCSWRQRTPAERQTRTRNTWPDKCLWLWRRRCVAARTSLRCWSLSWWARWWYLKTTGAKFIYSFEFNQYIEIYICGNIIVAYRWIHRTSTFYVMFVVTSCCVQVPKYVTIS